MRLIGITGAEMEKLLVSALADADGEPCCRASYHRFEFSK